MKTTKHTEKEIENMLIAECKRNGIYCRKFSSPSRRGVPDRILVHRGMVFFAEVKRPGGKVTALQLREINELKKQNMDVYIIDSKEKVAVVIDALLEVARRTWKMARNSCIDTE